MNPTPAQILHDIRRLEGELEEYLERRRTELGFFVHDGIVRFEEGVLKQHRALRTRLSNYVLGAPPLMLLTAPFIYLLIIPLALLDLMVMLYQFFCFPVYGVAKVHRGDYFVLDRHHLAYLNGIEKLNCLYCSYANGLISYVREVASRTEQYWCPIKHSRRIAAPHPRYWKFPDYGDAQGYREELNALRRELRPDAARHPDTPSQTRP